MTAHISSTPVLNHIKTATSASVDGTIYKTITVDSENLNIGPIKFPINLFDIGGMNPSTIHLMDSDHNMRIIMLLGEDDLKLDHPVWEIEPYDPTKLRNNHLLKL